MSEQNINQIAEDFKTVLKNFNNEKGLNYNLIHVTFHNVPLKLFENETNCILRKLEDGSSYLVYSDKNNTNFYSECFI